MSGDVAGTDWYQEDSASPMTVSDPASFDTVDQLLVFVICQDTGVIGDLTTPSGWTVAANNLNSTVEHGKVFSHEFNGSEPGTWGFPYGSGIDAAGGMFRCTGIAMPSVLVVPAPTTTSSNTSSLSSPSLNPSGVDDLLLSILVINGNGSVFSATPPSGMTSLGSVQVTAHFQAMAAASEQLVSGAATGTRTWTSISPTGQSAGAFSIAIASAEAAGASRRTPWNSSI